MTEDQATAQNMRASGTANRRTGRGIWFALLGVGLGLVLIVVVVAGVLWWRLNAGPVVLPIALQSRVEAALDGAMAQNDVAIGSVAIDLQDTGVPQVALSDVTLRDPDGRLRAAFPDLRATLSGPALLQGQVHPTQVIVAGAGLRLSRAADGSFDLEFGEEFGGATLSVPETLARIDAMFASPEFAALEAVVGRDLNLVMADSMTGQVMRLRDGQMRLTKTEGHLTLSFGGALEGSRDASVDIAITRRSELGETDLAMSFINLAARDVATIAPALAWLDLMRAPISGQLSARLADDGTLGDFGGVLRVGPGQFTVEGVGAPLSFAYMEAEMTYDAPTRRLRFERLRLDAPELSFSANGHADLSQDGTTYVGQFRLSGIEADPRGLFPAPLILDGAAVDLRLRLAPDLEIEIGQAVIFDGDVQILAAGAVLSNASGVSASLDAEIEQIAAEQVLAYWPVDAAPNTRRWIGENLYEGGISGADFALRLDPDGQVRHELQFDFQEARVRAVRTLPPIEEAAGFLRLTGPSLMVRLDEGQMLAPEGESLSLAGSTMQVADTRPRGPDARFDLAVQGGLSDVLRLLALPPVSLFAEGALTPEDIGRGDVDLTVGLDMRLLRGQTLADMDFAVAGTVTDYRSDRLVPERLLQAETLMVDVRPDEVVISGQARFDNTRLSGQWRRALGPDASPASRVEARAIVDATALAGFGITVPQGMITGRTRADLELDLRPDAPAQLSIRSDLQGMAVSVPALLWGLGAGQSGDLRVDMQLGPDPEITALSLDGAGLSLAGRVALAPGGGFERLVAERLRVGTWLDVAGALISNGVGRAPRIEVRGGALDLRNLPQSGQRPGAGAGGGVIDARLDRLQITEGIALTQLQAELSTNGGLSGQFAGLVNGSAPLTGTLITTETGPAVRVRSNDGGAVLRAAGLFATAHGGDMELIIGATGAEGSYDGQLSMSGPRLRDAPAMAELLNLISVVGLLEQLGGEGINLGDVDARFRITPTQVVLSQGTAVGPSMGLSMDGTYDVVRRQFDMQGVVSPLYALNGMFGALFAPRREGLFGFAYQLTGTPENNSVTVNPLSILTPGIFREIFRRPPPELPTE